MNKIELENKINLLRKMLILWYNIDYNIQPHHELGEYWTIGINKTKICPMLNILINIEKKVVDSIRCNEKGIYIPSPEEMIEMNKYYKACLISPKVRKFLHLDKKS